MRSRKSTIRWSLALLVLACVLASSLWVILAGPLTTYRVNGFRFEGPVGLDDSPSSAIGRTGGIGRRDPMFIVGPLTELGIEILLGSAHEKMEVGGRSALVSEYEAFAPGHGARDHYYSVYIPELGSGIRVYYRTRERDHDTGLADRLRAWNCRRWARAVISSLEWDASD